MDNQQVSKNLFGLNIALPKKSIATVKRVAKQEVENLTLKPIVDYFEENDSVFSGKVNNEIRKYQAKMYTLGQLMREGQTHSRLNINV